LDDRLYCLVLPGRRRGEPATIFGPEVEVILKSRALL
jgi:hypothetical protein